jgi:hypothetical protein
MLKKFEKIWKKFEKDYIFEKVSPKVSVEISLGCLPLTRLS